MSFLGEGEEVRNFTGNKNGGYSANADGLDRVRDGTVGGETLAELEGNLDDCINGGPPFQVLMEGRVVADSCMNLTEGNIFKKRSVRFTPMVCACKFLKSIRENLLTVDHHEVEFVQRGREVVSRKPHSVNEVVDRIVMRCEEEQLGAFLVAANLFSNIVRQSGSHSDYITDILWRKFVAPRGQAGRPVEKAIPRTLLSYILDVGRMRCRVTPAVGTIPSASQTVVGRQEMGKAKSQRYWRMSKGESRSAGRPATWASRRALNKEKSMEDGRWGLEPPRKPMALCANWLTKAS